MTGRAAKPPTTSAIRAILLAAGHAEIQVNGFPGGITRAGFTISHSGRRVHVGYDEPWAGPAYHDRAPAAVGAYANTISAAGWVVTRRGNWLTITRPGPAGKESRTTTASN